MLKAKEWVMKWGSAVSRESNIELAVDESIATASQELEKTDVDLAVVFISGEHAPNYDRIPEMVQRKLNAKVLIGCSAGGVIGGGQEVEQTPGFALTIAHLPGINLRSVHLEGTALPSPDAGPEAWERMMRIAPIEVPAFIVLADPFSYPTKELLEGLDYAYPDSVKIGGMASAALAPFHNVLYLGTAVHRTGAVVLAMSGDLVVDTIVAQGCRPIGDPLQVTKCNGNFLLELEKEPPVEALKRVVRGLNEEDKELAQHSLLLGIVMDGTLDHPSHGDFLIRNIMGWDPNKGIMQIGELLTEGQIVQFHLRDAKTSTEDLTELLQQYSEGKAGAQNEGALLFSCNGRGVNLYGQANHDTGLFQTQVGSIPLGGFFCAGEIGPVSGNTFLHGHTSSFAIFRPTTQK
jgi:small ligand-binding sensory domain FIST